MKINSIKRFFLFVALGFALPALADIAVIVHADNPVKLNAKEIRSIYLAKTNEFSNGDRVRPIDVNNNDEVRGAFTKKILRKSPSSLNSYWSRMIFSAKGTPPQTLSMAAAKAKVANDKSAIAYIDAALVDDSVRVVHTFK